MYKNTKISQTTHNHSSLEDTMFYGKSKKVIIIRDMHSNLFEEAILVLKEDRDKERVEVGKSAAEKSAKVDNDFILKEAESIIDNYIKDNKNKFYPPKKKEVPRTKISKNFLINSVLFGSIAAVIFLLVKLLL